MTVNRVLKKAKELNISWPLDVNDTGEVLAERLFSSMCRPVTSNKRMPDFAYIRKIYSVMESVKSSCGPNIWRIAVRTVNNNSCIVLQMGIKELRLQ